LITCFMRGKSSPKSKCTLRFAPKFAQYLKSAEKYDCRCQNQGHSRPAASARGCLTKSSRVNSSLLPFQSVFNDHQDTQPFIVFSRATLHLSVFYTVSSRIWKSSKGLEKLLPLSCQGDKKPLFQESASLIQVVPEVDPELVQSMHDTCVPERIAVSCPTREHA
jgi:hypothetical protein